MTIFMEFMSKSFALKHFLISLQICARLKALGNLKLQVLDLKPGNIMVNDGDVKIIDLGIARFVGDRCDWGFTNPNQILRQQPYMAPETIFDLEIHAVSEID